jgi:hypothetical protein
MHSFLSSFSPSDGVPSFGTPTRQPSQLTWLNATNFVTKVYPRIKSNGQERGGYIFTKNSLGILSCS